MVKTVSKKRRQNDDSPLTLHEETGGYCFMDVGDRDESGEEGVLSDGTAMLILMMGVCVRNCRF